MQERIKRQRLYKLAPAIPEALHLLENSAAQCGLEPALLHLIKARASQLNHCAFCLQMHHREARDDGEDQARLDMLPAWRDAPGFTLREQVALELCESLTLLPQHSVDDALFAELQKTFNEQELMALVMIILNINSWNRVVATMRFQPPYEDKL